MCTLEDKAQEILIHQLELADIMAEVMQQRELNMESFMEVVERVISELEEKIYKIESLLPVVVAVVVVAMNRVFITIFQLLMVELTAMAHKQ